jgi:hypothetical protein
VGQRQEESDAADVLGRVMAAEVGDGEAWTVRSVGEDGHDAVDCLYIRHK